MEQYVAPFMGYLTDHKRLSTATLECYKRDIEQFIGYLREREIVEPGQMTKAGVKLYFSTLSKAGKAPATIARSSVSLRAFFQYLQQERLIDHDPGHWIESPKIDKSAPQTLTVEEIDLLLDRPDTSQAPGLRDKAMMELLYATGIRVSELISLNVQDVDTSMRYVRCSGGKERIIPIGTLTANWVQRYLEESRPRLLGESAADVLFTNARGDRLTRQGFWKIVKKYGKDAGIETDITPHTLRHSFAVHLLEGGADVKSVQEMLGHTDLVTVQMYLNKTKTNLKSVYEAFHPRARTQASKSSAE
ncbi:site-specific tyrosine recombinase XerD [Paenibacillus lentus]|uniref:Tyrosine recombinase XerC n=1 Tax=Paenibacillus lentus TaxID=1338368 RepID=A0A3S8RWM9_9BACL|nr:site-specific tyrosine recombinase XerD [Paenibacillus lentus]AZK47097.1 site-specific tyrosine recombinase XerD [Paenibacillus lentus]